MSELIDDIAIDTTNKIEIWDNTKRAKILIIIFTIFIILLIGGIISGYLELVILKNAQEGIYVDDATANANDNRQMIIGLIQTVTYLISAIFFLRWFRRAYGNLHRLGINSLKHSETMAVWSWIIPIIVFFRPVQIMTEIWNKTQEKIKEYDASYTIKKGGLIIGLWWTLFIISNFVGRYVMKTTLRAETLEQFIEGSQATLISDLMQIPEALLVILIVYKLSKIESKLANEVEQNDGYIFYKN